MTIEAALSALTEAVKENTAVQASILQQIKGGGKATGGTADKASTTKADKAKKATLDDIKKTFTEFLGVEDKDLRAKRKEQVGQICKHFDAERATAIAEENWPEALKAVKMLEKGETPDFMEDESGDDESLV